MLLKIKRQIEETETIELQTPAYFKDGNEFWKIADENNFIKVLGKRMITAWDTTGYCFTNDLQEIVKHESATEAEFMNAFNAVMSVINPLINNAKSHV